MSAPATDEPDADPVVRLLRAHAPPPVDDDGFTARTLQAIPNVVRTRLDAARALVLEQRRYARQARMWRWALGGIVAGMLLVVAAIASAPGDVAIDLAPQPGAPAWLPLSALLVAGAIWYAWSEFRKN